MKVYQDTQSPVEKRVAAYLTLINRPSETLIKDIIKSLDSERDEQLKSFVVSHLKNIRNSDEPPMDQ